MSPIFLLTLALCIVGWAVFLYALHTEPTGRDKSTHDHRLPCALLACVLAGAVTLRAEELVPLAAQCEAWWAAGDYYHWFLYQCYIFGFAS